MSPQQLSKEDVSPHSLVREVVVRLVPHAAHLYNVEVFTAQGVPSELSVYGIDRDGAAEVLAELPQLLAECPEAAETPIPDFDTMRVLAQAGVTPARAAALVARPLRADIIQAKKYPAVRLG